MAPEQVLRLTVDARTGICAAGVVLVEMLIGRRPVPDGADVRSGYRLPADVPQRTTLDDALLWCLAVAPRARFASAVELKSALLPALGTE
jgi:hypothetical protein